ncbi:MAG: hypothetical protein JSW34_03415 [Candidatus Zixiibacteriota bacterium]|nr:MAG: hypothetical protein JSW34_03415 [candidate division Zixibacteria bacterium]
MESVNLLVICVSAFAVVFFTLTMLALVMRLIMAVFPEKVLASDSAVVVAIASVASAVYPHAKVTKVEEIK